MEYPRYTREQKLSCKLTEKDIVNMREEYFLFSVSYKVLANKYRVSRSTVFYYIHPRKREQDCRDYITPEQNRERVKKFLIRKKKLQPEIRRYNYIFIKEKMANDPEYRKKRLKAIYDCQKARL